MEQLELYRVAPQLEEVHYVPEYVSVEQERSVIDEVRESPCPAPCCLNSAHGWTNPQRRRVADLRPPWGLDSGEGT
jgi:hypothetical protein